MSTKSPSLIATVLDEINRVREIQREYEFLHCGTSLLQYKLNAEYIKNAESAIVNRDHSLLMQAFENLKSIEI